MARYFKSVLIIISLLGLSLFTSCQEGREAGDLLGQWRMEGSDKQYISFSGSLTLIRNVGDRDVWGHFQHRGDSLYIQCYSVYAAAADTLLVEQLYGFKPFTNIRLRIQTLDSDRLVLTKGDKTWNFYKY
jgi:hypothetical protein